MRSNCLSCCHSLCQFFHLDRILLLPAQLLLLLLCKPPPLLSSHLFLQLLLLNQLRLLLLLNHFLLLLQQLQLASLVLQVGQPVSFEKRCILCIHIHLPGSCGWSSCRCCSCWLKSLSNRGRGGRLTVVRLLLR